MSLKMKFATMAIVLGVSSVAIAEADKNSAPAKVTPEQIGDGMAACHAIIQFVDTKKLIEYSPEKVSRAKEFFTAESEKRIGDKFLPAMLNYTFNISQAYSSAKLIDPIQQLLAEAKLIAGADKCMTQYERSLK